MNSLLASARNDRPWGLRNHLLILMSYNHGLRAVEALNLKWSDVDYDHQTVWIKRIKGSVSGIHPLVNNELKLLNAWRNSHSVGSPFVFCKKNGDKLSYAGMYYLVVNAGLRAVPVVNCHPHMLRHSCGFKLANAGIDTRRIQAWLGHKSINNTVVYTDLAPGAFEALTTAL
jgi:type 1 fimbriae regulatory protein FimB/type 1 fimbriae regulatory protein FimE